MKPNWTPRRVRLGQIQAWDGNPRMSTKAQAQRIIQSERKFGQPVPFLLAPEQDGRFLLYDGHQRLAAWFTVYGADYEMDAMVSDRPLTEAEHKELVITLHTGATGSWNWDALASWSAGDLQEWGMNSDSLKTWNTDANNLKELLNAETAEPVDAEPQIDRAAELAEKWQTASGQLWKLGEHRLLIGDCTVRENVERLMGGERAKLAPVDPPYNVGFDYDGETVDDQKTEEKYKEFCHAWFGECQRVSEKQIVTAGCYNLPSWLRWFDSYHVGTWIKSNSMTNGRVSRFWCWEPVIFFGEKFGKKRTNDIFDYPIGQQKDVANHPCPKPLKMWEDLIENYSEPNDIIYECFGGSGTTLIACVNTGRICRTLEISEKYGAVILERFYTATGITPELAE